jgi:hypothetical protein
MQGEWQFCMVCICILEGGHFSIPDADADPGMTGLALSLVLFVCLCVFGGRGQHMDWMGEGVGYFVEIYKVATQPCRGRGLSIFMLSGRGVVMWSEVGLVS